MRAAHRVVAGWALFAAAGSATAAPEAAPGLDARFRAAKERLVADLVALAQRTVGEGLEARREHTLRFVLTLDPDQPEARRALGWKRKKDGPWTAPPDRPPPVDQRPARLPAWRERWDAAFSRARDALLPGLEAEPPAARVEALALLRRGLPDDAAVRAALDPVLASLHDPAARIEDLDRLDDALEAHAPDDAAVRAARGHVRRRDRWVLAETVRASERRPALGAGVKAALAAGSKPSRVDVHEEESATGLAPLRAWEARASRVVGTVGDAVLSRVAFHLDRSGPVFDALFGRERDWDPPTNAWEVRDLREARRVAGHFGGGDSRLDEMRHYASTWVGSSVLTWDRSGRDEPEWRVDAGLKQAQRRRLVRTYGLGRRGEALTDALARYLVWRQVGTRLTWPLDRSYVGPLSGSSLGSLHDPGFDWAGAAAKILEPRKARGALRLAIGQTIEAQTPEDAVVCYAFACYLFEGHEAAAHPFAQSMGDEGGGDSETPRDLDAVFCEVFGWRVEQVERRLERWCREAGR